MASPRLLYYAEQAAKIPTTKAHQQPAPARTDLAPAQGVTNGLGLGLAFWFGAVLLALVLVYQ